MDPQAHLLSLGWAGPGHALDSYKQKGRRGLAYDPASKLSNTITATGNGLVKPLLIAQKKNTFGIGKRAHEPAAGNEWWLKGFERALENIGKSGVERERSERGSASGTVTPEAGRTGYKGKHEGLYGFFVGGSRMEGTIGEEGQLEPRGEQVNEETERKAKKKSKKRKSDDFDVDPADESYLAPSSTTHEAASRSNSLLGTKRRSKNTTTDFKQAEAYLTARDKDRKRADRRTKPTPLEEFAHVGSFLQAISEAGSKRKKKEKKALPDGEQTLLDTPTAEPASPAVTEVKESKEERRRRRRERRAARDADAKASASRQSSDKENRGESLSHTTTKGVEDVVAMEQEKAARKAERKRRKEEQREVAA